MRSSHAADSSLWHVSPTRWLPPVTSVTCVGTEAPRQGDCPGSQSCECARSLPHQIPAGPGASHRASDSTQGHASPCTKGPRANQHHHVIPRQVRSARLPASKALNRLLILLSISISHTSHLLTRPSPALRGTHSPRPSGALARGPPEKSQARQEH